MLLRARTVGLPLTGLPGAACSAPSTRVLAGGCAWVRRLPQREATGVPVVRGFSAEAEYVPPSQFVNNLQVSETRTSSHPPCGHTPCHGCHARALCSSPRHLVSGPVLHSRASLPAVHRCRASPTHHPSPHLESDARRCFDGSRHTTARTGTHHNRTHRWQREGAPADAWAPAQSLRGIQGASSRTAQTWDTNSSMISNSCLVSRFCNSGRRRPAQ
eukprot:SAG31_NODE_1101_length_9905_cov_3.367122_13_plen_216_part_00